MSRNLLADPSGAWFMRSLLDPAGEVDKAGIRDTDENTRGLHYTAYGVLDQTSKVRRV